MNTVSLKHPEHTVKSPIELPIDNKRDFCIINQHIFCKDFPTASASASTASQGRGGTDSLDKPNASLELHQ